jgi:hypothetical protein
MEAAVAEKLGGGGWLRPFYLVDPVGGHGGTPLDQVNQLRSPETVVLQLGSAGNYFERKKIRWIRAELCGN